MTLQCLVCRMWSENVCWMNTWNIDAHYFQHVQANDMCLQNPQRFVLQYDNSMSFINPNIVICIVSHSYVFCQGSSFISLLTYCWGPWFQMDIFLLMLDIGQLKLTSLMYLCIPDLAMIQSWFIPLTRSITFPQSNLMQVSALKKALI